MLYVSKDKKNTFTKINDAIMNAKEYEEIFIYPVTYKENIDITKNLPGIGNLLSWGS